MTNQPDPRARTPLTVTRLTTRAEVDELPPGAVVLTYSPRLVPPQCVWMSTYTDKDGHWWLSGLDDSFDTDDVLYKDPEIVLLLWHPEWAKEFAL